MEPGAINKISRPAVADVFLRERLFAQLDRSLGRPVVWISGPGGAGKSTLAASYLDARRIPCLWYQVDQGDGDVATLFYYLGLAVERLVPGNRARLPLLTPEYQLGLAAFASRYFEQFFSILPCPTIVVFDDYHEVAADSPFHEVLLHGMMQIPEGVRVVVTSRRAPPPALVRLRARRKMGMVGWSELRLSPEETAGIVRIHDRNPRETAAIDALHDKAQGWVAGLVLMMECGGHDDGALAPLPAERTPTEVFDYFAWETFNRTEKAVQGLLLRAALMPTFTPSMVAQISGNAAAPRILAELSRNNYFTERRSEAGELYRFHPLFREFLLKQGEVVLAPNELIEVKRVASRILRQHSQVEDAAVLAVDARDWEGLTGLILDNAQDFINQGRSGPVRKWLESVPNDLVKQNPSLLFWRGACTLAVNPDESRAHLEGAFSLFRAHGDRPGLFLSWCAVVDTAIHANEYLHMRQWIEVLHGVLRENPVYPSEEIEVRVALSLFNAVAFGLPNHPDIHAIRERALLLVCTENIADANLYLGTVIHLVIHFIYQGDFIRAGLVLDLLKEAAGSKEATDLVLILVKTIEAHYAFATCSLDTCIEKAFEALTLAARSGVHLWDMHLYGHALAAALAKGDEAAVAEFMPKMSAGLGDCRFADRTYCYWLKAWNCALRETFSEARHFLELALNVAARIGFLAPETVIQINMAEICLELGSDQEAAVWLEKALPRVQSIDSAYLSYCCLLTESYLHFKRGNETRGIECLGKAFSVGREHRIENFFFWRPALMARLCLKALEAGIEVEYATGLIRKRGLRPVEPPVHVETWPWPIRIHTLGRFALEVDGVTREFAGKVPKKPLELLQTLVAFGGEVDEQALEDALWPDADGDTARQSFKVTLHRLRQLLGIEGAVVLRHGRLALDGRQVWTDVAAFAHLLDEARAARDEGREDDAARLSTKAAALYRGEFLPGEDAPWATPMRQRLQGKSQRCQAPSH